jgi:toxin ParE1/3/4
MRAPVAEYRLTVRAHADVLSIYAFSEERFGRYQAEAYHAGLERTFGLLADFPRIGVAADELVPGYHRFRFQSHYIFYTEESDHVLIRALIHVRQDLRSALFE